VTCVHWYAPFTQLHAEPGTGVLHAVVSGQSIALVHLAPSSGQVAPSDGGASHSLGAASRQVEVWQRTAAERHGPPQLPMTRPAPCPG